MRSAPAQIKRLIRLSNRHGVNAQGHPMNRGPAEPRLNPDAIAVNPSHARLERVRMTKP